MAEETYACEQCGSSTHEDLVSICLSHGERIVIVEKVPARVCDRCFEQYYDQLTTFRLDQLRGTGFKPADAARIVEVPVFTFPQDAAPEAEAKEPVTVDRRGTVYDWWADV
ncbi:MAG TPA: YgiT-type zinc finger protein [bacterium]|nr:YgiT-type zinc finger protein [bacterium]